MSFGARFSPSVRGLDEFERTWEPEDVLAKDVPMEVLREICDGVRDCYVVENEEAWE